MFFHKKNQRRRYGNEGSSTVEQGRRGMLCSKMCFAAKESYKLLRTNLEFTFSDVDGCRIIGVTSPVRAEGKSLTAINIAYTFAESGKRVLLMEGDLRIPTIAKKLRLYSESGLSNILARQGDPDSIIQRYDTDSAADSKATAFHVMTSGSIPPNPSELLGSKRMQALLEALSQRYDLIIVDLPPITAVSDALVMSRMVSGIIMVVRQNHTERGGLAEAMRQLEFVNGKILGFVFNAASETSAGYGRKYKYKYRYRYYAAGGNLKSVPQPRKR